MSRPPSAGEALARPQQPLRVRERVGPRVVSLPFVVARSTALVKQCSVLERGLWESLRPALAVQRPVLPIPCRLMLRRRPQTTWPPQGQGFCQAGPSFWKPAFGSLLSYPPSDSLWQAPRPGHLPVSGPAQHRCPNPAASRPSVHHQHVVDRTLVSECPGLRALPGRRRLAPNPGDAFSLSLFTFFLEGEIQGEKLRDLGCNLFLEKGHSQVESAFFQDHFGWRGRG